MIRENTRAVLGQVSQGRLMQTVEEIATYHRIQASPGYRAAAEHIAVKLNRQGIEAQVLSFPAEENVIFGTYPSFQEWSCREAWCAVGGQRIADFDASAMSVIQRSIACDYRDKPLEIVYLDKGSEEKNYKNTDIEGKIVFVREDFNKSYRWAVEKRGAVGIITDFVLQDPHVRERYDQLDTIRYTSFWWKPGQKKAFGFVLSPREGDHLAALCEKENRAGRPVTATCFVEAELYNGSIEDVCAFLPGETEEEILLVAHLCHPRASANDNASGCAAAMEAMLVIKNLIDTGALPKLKRGIRMLLVPEFTGSYAYLDRIGADDNSIVAALNLDMVGGRQQGGYGPLTLTDLPMTTPGFVTDAAATVLDEIKKQVTGMMPESYSVMFSSHITEYSGGSDHIVFSDPLVDIPCPMLGQWPDKFYHTSSDTVSMVDPYLLSRSAALAAAYAYSLANLEVEDIADICNTAVARTALYLTDLRTKMVRGKMEARFYSGRVKRYMSWRISSIDVFGKYFEQDISDLLKREKERLLSLGEAITGIRIARAQKHLYTARQAAKYNIVAKRRECLPISAGKLIGMFDADKNREIDDFISFAGQRMNFSVISALDHFIDGYSPSVAIAENIAYEFGIWEPEVVDRYIRLLVKLGYANQKK